MIILSNGINNFLEYFDEKKATDAYFMILALAFVFIGLGLPTNVRFFELFNYLASYHLFDEIIGRGCIFDWWEIVFAVLTLIYVYRASIFKKVRC